MQNQNLKLYVFNTLVVSFYFLKMSKTLITFSINVSMFKFKGAVLDNVDKTVENAYQKR